MSSRARILRLLALAALLTAAPASPARAAQSYTPSEAYAVVAAAYAQGGSRLDPCAFTTAELEAALRGIPPAFRTTVPALRRAIQDAIATHKRGACKGIRPTEAATGGAAPGTVPPVTTTPSVPATTPAATAPSTVTTPGATTTSTVPAPAPASTTPARPPASGGDRTPLVVALIAAGALLLAALALWGLARSRGWDPPWVARARHAWGEAGFRTTSTWAEFTDWLRLGR